MAGGQGRLRTSTTLGSFVAAAGCALMVTTHDALEVLGALAAAVGCAVHARVMGGRPAAPFEAPVWRAFSRVALATAAALVAESLMTVAITAGPGPAAWAGGGFALGAVVVCAVMYQGLIVWNRFRSDDSDPGDWLNGACAVLVTVALLRFLIDVTDASMSTWHPLQMHLWVATLAALVVLSGSAATIASLGGMSGDRRLYLITGALVLAAAGQVVLGLTVGGGAAQGWIEVTWVLIVCILGHCYTMPPIELRRPTGTSQTATIGALVVIMASIVLLLLAALLGESSPGTVLTAGAAALGSGARLLQLIASLAQLGLSQAEARTDDLTGVANRRALTIELSAAERVHDVLALLVIDLDRFKEVNDQHGHAVGDQLLRSVATRLQAIMPVGALLGRLGGDEFAVLLRGATEAEATVVAHSVVATCAMPVTTTAGTHSLGASVGVATTDATSRMEGELMRRADTAMYVAKRAGGGVRVFDSRGDRAAREERRRAEELRAALGPAASAAELDQFVVFFQPQLSLQTGDVVGAEALVRWLHPHHGLLSPATFLELVERHGLMDRLTSVVLRKAAFEAARWAAGGRAIRISVNVSASSLTSPDFVDMVEKTVHATGLAPALLVLEITETTLMKDPDRSMAVMRTLSARGFEISIDDYGTGYSSLAYLNDLPAAELKLDRSFTSRLVHDRRTAAIVAGTIDLAHGLGLRLVAEGVEDAPTVQLLKDLGCDESQGYLHAMPMSSSEFAGWLAEATVSPAGDPHGVERHEVPG
jgi:diguanylate cyclase (GGDEF)-like protein